MTRETSHEDGLKPQGFDFASEAADFRKEICEARAASFKAKASIGMMMA